MQIIIFLGQDDRFYLSTKSCLNHRHHPALKADALLHGHIDMEQGDLDLLSLLFSVNATGVQISQIMQSLKGPETGIYLPKRIYDMNQKTEQLQDLALGLIPGCSNANFFLLNCRSEYIYFPFFLILNFKKVFSLPFLTFNFVSFCFRAVINCFYVVHENGSLYACSNSYGD